MLNPIMVAGPGEFDTELMTAAGGRLFSKMGAEGYLIIGVMPGALKQHSPGLGIAIKICDGDRSGRARSSVALAILAGIGILDHFEMRKMTKFGNIPVKNWRNMDVGEIRPAFTMKKLKK
jgi:L-asparaginase II